MLLHRKNGKRFFLLRNTFFKALKRDKNYESVFNNFILKSFF